MAIEIPITSATSQWPPQSSSRRRRNTITSATTTTQTTSTHTAPDIPQESTTSSNGDSVRPSAARSRAQTVSQSTRTLTKQWRNGYEVKHKAPSYTPYSLRSGRTFEYRKAFAFDAATQVQSHEALGTNEWNQLAAAASVIRPGWRLRDFQVDGSNIIIRRKKDLVVIVPTGHGKSLLWILPLLVRKESISLVVTPFTSLGSEGEME